MYIDLYNWSFKIYFNIYTIFIQYLYNYNIIKSVYKSDFEISVLLKKQKLSLLASNLTDFVQSLLLSVFESESLSLLTETKVNIQ